MKHVVICGNIIGETGTAAAQLDIREGCSTKGRTFETNNKEGKQAIRKSRHLQAYCGFSEPIKRRLMNNK